MKQGLDSLLAELSQPFDDSSDVKEEGATIKVERESPEKIVKKKPGQLFSDGIAIT